MKKLTTYISIIIFLYSCSVTKYVPEGEQLLTNNNIIIDSIDKNEEEINQYLVQRPNFKTLGVPLSLYFYNLGNPKGSIDVLQWKKNNHNLYNNVSFIFSEKQSISMAKSLIGFNQWFLKNGQGPVVINEEKIKKSEQNLKTYFQNNGYFNAEITSKKDTISLKKGEVTYVINKGRALYLDSLSVNIKSPTLDSLYRNSTKESILKINQQYKNQNFINESERITKLFRNNGIYHFNTNSIAFDIDTLSNNYKASVNIKIEDRIIEEDGKYKTKPYETQYIKKINVFTDFAYNKKNDTPTEYKNYNNINFYAFDKLRYKPKYLAQSIFLKPNQIYSDTLRNLTRTHLRGLKNFRTTNIEYKKLNNNELEANIYLTPIERYSYGVETELSRSNIRLYDVTGKFFMSNRNTFKGTEIFKVSGFGSYFKSVDRPGWEIGGDISLEIPRFIVPFGLTKLVPKRMFPKTRFFGGTSVQKNIGLDRQNYNLGIDYKWKFNKRKSIHIELLNTQYTRNFNVNQYFNIYKSEYYKLADIANVNNTPISDLDNYINTVNFMRNSIKDYDLYSNYPEKYQILRNTLNRHNIVTSDFLIPTISYSFTYNSQKNYRDQSFSFFKIRLANSGNVIGLLTNQENYRNKNTILNIPIAQYFKTDIEYKKFWTVSRSSVLGIRCFGGIIFRYNKSDIPFSKSYFAGGSNDIRAWRTYDLGPGNRPRGLEYNVGNFKLLGNIEYRFDIIGSIKGAFFIDTGNIWDITQTKSIDNPAKLDDLKDITNIAIGTGLGIRYDFKFLVARLDLGLKAREPYLIENKWFQNFSLNETQYNIGINYPF